MLFAVVSDINTVDEAQRSFYEEKDGKFFLKVTAAEGYELDNTASLKNALGAERNLKKGLETQLKAFEGIDATLARQSIERVSAFGEITPEAAKAAIETAKRLQALDPAKEADKIAEEKVKIREDQLKGVFQTREQELISKVTASETTIDGLTKQLQSVMRDNQVKTELAKLNPLDDARDAIELLATRYIKTSVENGQVVVKVLDENGHPRIKDANTDFSVADLLTEIKDKKPGLFKADDKRGIGITPSSGVSGGKGQSNPWAKDTWNMTQQMLLTKSNPNLAKQMKAQAGVA